VKNQIVIDPEEGQAVAGGADAFDVSAHAVGAELPGGTVTFLFTDIEGSTRIGRELGDDFAVLLADHDRLLRTAITDNNGIVVKGLGDGLFAAFAAPEDAVTACVDGMAAITGHAWPRDVELRVRMAVHTGEAIPVGDDYVSLAVHQAARVVDAAHGGQILVTDATAAACTSLPPGATLQELGKFRLKDFDAPVGLAILRREGLPVIDAALRVLPLAGHNMPLLRTSFVGRDEDLRLLQKMLDEHPLVTVTGPGGIGKSRTAARAAGELVPSYPDGVWLVELAPVDATAVITTVAAVLGLPPLPDSAGADAVARHLENRRLLLVLDNCEHVIEEVAGLVDVLLSRCSNLRIIATSRQHLGVDGEQRLPLRPLPVPEPVATATEVLDTAGGRLFVERAAASYPEFVLTHENAQAVARICRRLDGMPLALELAAARVRHFDVLTLAEHVDRRLEILVSSGRGHPRHRTLTALLDWSHDLLDDQQRALFHRLAVFAGGATLDAVTDVCADDLVPSDQVLDVLAELVDRSLVIVSEQQSGRLRYSLLETAREYAAARLAVAAEADAVRAAHRRHFLGLAARLGGQVHAEPTAVRQLEDERDNLRAAFAEAIANAPEEAVTGVVDLALFWQLRGHLDEAQRIIDAVAAAVDATDELTSARLDLARGRVLSLYDSVAIELLTRCAPVFVANDEMRTAAVALASCARALAEYGRFDEAEDIARTAYDSAAETGDTFSLATAGLVAAYAVVARGDTEDAERIAAEARAASLSQPRQTASIDDFRGWCAQLRGDTDAAVALHRSALTVFEDFADTRSRSVVTMHLAEAALRRGDLPTVVDEGVASAVLALSCYSPGSAANALLFVAAAVADTEPATAARICGHLSRLADHGELPLSGDEEAWHQQSARRSRGHLGDSAYDKLAAEGATTSIEELVDGVRRLLLSDARSAA
jgi:predicted ATPase/class 3 adenylate cyclase